MKKIIALALSLATTGCAVNPQAMRDFSDALESANNAMAPAVKARNDRTDALVDELNRRAAQPMNQPVNCQTVYYPGGARTRCQ